MKNINYENYLNNKYFVYFLGLFWADGYFSSPEIKNNRVYSTFLTLTEKDFDQIYETAFKFLPIDYKIYNKKVQGNRKPQKTLYVSGKGLGIFLNRYDYWHKKNHSPNKILNKLTPEMKIYWLRGYFDGDGCIFVGNRSCSLFFTSNINQDWSFMENIFDQLTIKSYKFIYHNGKHSYSRILFQNADGVIKIKVLFDSIDASIGLTRKWKKIMLVYNKFCKPPTKKAKPSFEGGKWVAKFRFKKKLYYNGRYNLYQDAQLASNKLKLKEWNKYIKSYMESIHDTILRFK